MRVIAYADTKPKLQTAGKKGKDLKLARSKIEELWSASINSKTISLLYRFH